MMNAKSLLEFLRQHRLTVQSSVSSVGAPQAAVVGYGITDDFEIIFDTLDSTRKARNLGQNSQIALVIGGLNSGEEKTVQYEGIADIPTGAELERLKPFYYKAWPDGPSRLSWTGLIYVRVKPTWIRYSNFSADPPEIVEFTSRELDFLQDPFS
jgi:hypothetical protein